MLASALYCGFIPVRDAAAARRFYEGVLGLTVVDDTPFALVVDAHGVPVRLTLVPDFRPQPFTIAGWAVPDVAAAARALAERGVDGNRYEGMEQDDLGIWTAPGDGQVFRFADPDGNTLSLTTPASP